MALGAAPSRLVRLVLGQTLAVVMLGAGIGLLASLWVGRSLRSLLFAVEPTDPSALFAASVLLIVVAALSSTVPAYRIARVDPLRTLREE